MSCPPRNLSSLLLSISFLLLFSSASSSTTISGAAGVVSLGVIRLEGVEDQNSTLVLAAHRTHRKDPLDDFKYYTGGWNISNRHYISSVAFTSAPLFAVAVLWFVGVGISFLLMCLCYCCCRRQPYGYSPTAYALSLFLLILFTVGAVVGCVVLYTGQGKFQSSTSNTLDYVVSQADSTYYNLKNVSYYLASAKQVGVDQIFLPTDVQNSIDKVDKMINSSANTLNNETNKNSKDIRDALNAVRLALIIVSAVMLLVALLGFLSSICGFQFLVYIFVIMGWILVTVTLILCGIFLALHNVMGDTCVAMNQWVEHPTAHTALDDILPCVDNATAQQTLSQSKDVIFQMVGMVNRVIINVSNINPPRSAPIILSYNQSGPLVPILCNPYNSNETARNCATGELDLSNATEVWSSYVCQVSKNGTCTTVGRLTPTMYNQMTAAVNVSYGLYKYGPFLAGLLDCTFVRDAFTVINQRYCPGLKQYSEWIYIGLAMVSAAVMLSLIFWVLYGRERKHRKYTKLAQAASAQSSFAKR